MEWYQIKWFKNINIKNRNEEMWKVHKVKIINLLTILKVSAFNKKNKIENGNTIFQDKGHPKGGGAWASDPWLLRN